MATQDPFAELTEFLRTTRSELKAAVLAVPREQHSRKPSPESWSVAEVLEHLALVERRITELLAAAALKAREDGGAPSVSGSIVGSIKLRDRSRRIEARESNLPSRGLDSDAALAQLDAARDALLALVDDAQRVDLSTAVYPHPIFGELNGYQWLAFIGGHELRHTDQIHDIAKQLSLYV
jgi:uncharacterized damage-inducible protein DinB